MTKKAKSIAIIGGGFLGSELACALGHRGICITSEQFLGILLECTRKVGLSEMLRENWILQKNNIAINMSIFSFTNTFSHCKDIVLYTFDFVVKKGFYSEIGINTSFYSFSGQKAGINITQIFPEEGKSVLRVINVTLSAEVR